MYVCLCKSVWWKNKSPSQLLLDEAGSSCFFSKLVGQFLCANFSLDFIQIVRSCIMKNRISMQIKDQELHYVSNYP